MKAVILAAGLGTRLSSTIPKPLVTIFQEKSILDFQIEKLRNRIGEHNIFIVVGYKKELIMEKYPGAVYIYNDLYARTNTAKSLLMALEKIDDDVVWLNGDVYFDEKILDLLLRAKTPSSVVSRGKCGAEEVKYRDDENGLIIELSKNVEKASF